MRWGHSAEGVFRNSMFVRGLLGTGPPDPNLEFASPSPPQGSIWHQNRVTSGYRCRIDATSTSEEGRARRIRGWGPGGLPLIKLKPLTTLCDFSFCAFPVPRLGPSQFQSHFFFTFSDVFGLSLWRLHRECPKDM